MSLEYFENRERKLLGTRYEQLYAPPKNRAERGITVNTLRCTAEQFLKQVDFSVKPSAFCYSGFSLEDDDFRPGRHPYHHAGVYYVQEPSASAPAALLDVQPGMRVLDLCAAPGGKSSQLGAALAGKGFLVSNEFSALRAEILKNNMERMGFANVVVLNETTERIAAALPGAFDRVLLDAPCSGEGMFRKEPQAMAQHNEGLVQQCAALGRQILEDAATCLMPGGILLYSTCTFAPEEDEGQIAAFLQRHPEFELLPTTQDFGAPGEENRTGSIACDVSKMRRIWPCHGGEGHFMAKLKKSENAEPQNAKPQKPQKEKLCAEWVEFCAQYFPELKAQRYLRMGDSVLLPPELPAMGSLHILRSGVLAGTVQKGRFEPNHHLFMVNGAECRNIERLTLQDKRTAAWLRGEEIEASTAQKGWCSVLVDGFPMGGGKMSGGKIKNHYPKALRNLK